MGGRAAHVVAAALRRVIRVSRWIFLTSVNRFRRAIVESVRFDVASAPQRFVDSRFL